MIFVKSVTMIEHSFENVKHSRKYKEKKTSRPAPARMFHPGIKAGSYYFADKIR